MDKCLISVGAFDRAAELYEEKYMDLALYNDTYDQLCSYIDVQGASILDVGCGPGNITRYLLSRRPDFRVLGIDLAPNMVSRARANNPKAEFLVADCRNILSLGRKFDAVTCGFCLPYLSKPEVEKLLKDVSSLLYPGGLLYLTAMEGEHERSGVQVSSRGDEVYVYFYTVEFISKLLQENGFDVLDIIRKDSPENAPTKTSDVCLLARLQRLLGDKKS